MEKDTTSQNGKIIMAAVIGAAAGALLALLFAPAKGSETRRKIVDSAEELGEKIREKAREWQNRGDENGNVI